MSEPKAVSRFVPLVVAFLAGLLVLSAVVYLARPSASPIGPGGPFHLEDQTGRPVSDQDMKGRPFLEHVPPELNWQDSHGVLDRRFYRH